MTTAGSFDAPIEIFGGLVTDMSPADLPHGVSPDCQDVVFSNGGVETRPGLQTLFGPLAGNPTVNYVKTYETLNATLRALVMDSNGLLYKETTPGTLANIASSPTLSRYSKAPEHGYSRALRAQVLDQARSDHAQEIRKGLALLDAAGKRHTDVAAVL